MNLQALLQALTTGYVPVQDPNAIPSWLRQDAPLAGPPPVMPIPGPNSADVPSPLLGNPLERAPVFNPSAGVPAPSGPDITQLFSRLFSGTPPQGGSLTDGPLPMPAPESGIPAPAPGPGILDLIAGMFSGGGAAAAPTPVAPANPFAEAPIPGEGGGSALGALAQRWLANVPAEMRVPVGEAPATGLKVPSAGDVVRSVAPTGSALAAAFPAPTQAAVPGAGPGAKPTITWFGDQANPGANQGPVSGTFGGAPADPLELTKRLLRQKEGFIDTPRWDVNAHRVGYGSDTITNPDGTVRAVKPGDKITREQAEADLDRRIPEFQGTIIGQIGGEAWQKLTPNAQAALTSMAYNYGSLPSKVVAAAKTGSGAEIAKAISDPEYLAHNKGVNANRRLDEARIAAGGEITGQRGTGTPFPGAPNYVAPSLPAAPTMQALKGVDPAAFDRFSTERVMMAPPLSTEERVTNILANMAAGARGAKTAADVLLGAGAGAGRGATENIAQERGELQRGAEKSSALNRFFAEVGVRKAGAVAEGQNFQTDAANKNATLQHAVATAQAKADADAKNALEEAKGKLDLAKFNTFKPQITSVTGGILTTWQKPDGSLDWSLQKTDDLKADAERYKNIETKYGKGSAMAQAERYKAIEETKNKPLYIRSLLEDLVESGWVANALTEKDFKSLQDTASKGLNDLRAKPESFKKAVDEKMTGLLLQMWADGKLPEEAFIPFLANKGHVGAMRRVTRPNG